MNHNGRRKNDAHTIATNEATTACTRCTAGPQKTAGAPPAGLSYFGASVLLAVGWLWWLVYLVVDGGFVVVLVVAGVEDDAVTVDFTVVFGVLVRNTISLDTV
jgi:hypothetical protein